MYILMVKNLDNEDFYVCKVKKGRESIDLGHPVDPLNKFGGSIANKVLAIRGSNEMLESTYQLWVEKFSGNPHFIEPKSKRASNDKKKSTDNKKSKGSKTTTTSTSKSKKSSNKNTSSKKKNS